MLKRFKLVDVEEAAAGMVLYHDVCDERGKILLPKATALTDAMLNSLRRRGIARVAVANDEVSEEQIRAERERVEKRLAVLFRKAKGDRVSALLRQGIMEYRLGDTQ